MYLTMKLQKVGITATRVRDVLEQALKLDTVEALQTALNCSLTGASWALKQQGMTLEERSVAVRQLLEVEPFVSVRKRLKELE